MRTVLAAMTCVAVFGVSTAWAQDRSSGSVETRGMHVYSCPRHPEMKATWPGRCPRCGAWLREKGRPAYRGEEAGHREGRSAPTVVQREAAGPYYSPEALLRARQRLNLSDRQMRELREIEMAARRKAWSVLTDAQVARLRSYIRTRAMNRERNALRDRLRDQCRDWYRDRARDWYRDQARDWDRDQARDRWHDGQRWNNWSDPYGSLYDYDPTAYGFDYGLRPRVELAEEDEGFGDEGFGDEGFGDEGFGGEGFGDEGFGGEGFGEGFGGEEGFGNEGFRGEEGFGNEGFGGERFGGEGFGNEGFRGEEGFGNEGFGGERFGGEGFGNEGFRGEEGFGNEGFGGERFGGGEGFRGGEMGGARESGGEARGR